VIISVSC